MQKITPFLWFNSQALEAANFYVSLFPDSKIVSIMPGQSEETASGVHFELVGQGFMAINGGPQFSFTPAISFFITCETQEEIDHYWEKLSEGGQKKSCGWLEDKYGVSWQVIPQRLGEMLTSSDKEKTARAMQAMLQMDKIEIVRLEAAFAGASKEGGEGAS